MLNQPSPDCSSKASFKLSLQQGCCMQEPPVWFPSSTVLGLLLCSYLDATWQLTIFSMSSSQAPLCNSLPDPALLLAHADVQPHTLKQAFPTRPLQPTHSSPAPPSPPPKCWESGLYVAHMHMHFVDEIASTDVIVSHGGCRAAAEVLAVADAQLPYSNSPALQAARLGLAHSRALHRGDARHAALFASQLLGLADPTDSVCKTLRCCSLIACTPWQLKCATAALSEYNAFRQLQYESKMNVDNIGMQ